MSRGVGMEIKKGIELKQYLKELRRGCGYPQEYVASKLNICRQTYSHYETGRIRPPAQALYRIADLYGVSAKELLDMSVSGEMPEVAERRAMGMGGYPGKEPAGEDGEAYGDHMDGPSNGHKLQYLDTTEKQLIYYYENLDLHSKMMAMTIMKVFFDNCGKGYAAGRDLKGGT